MVKTTDPDNKFSFKVVFTYHPNLSWWALDEFLGHQYTLVEFKAEVMNRSGCIYDLLTWLMNNPSHWADFVNTFDIEYKEK
jgi:hypothetical protein